MQLFYELNYNINSEKMNTQNFYKILFLLLMVTGNFITISGQNTDKKIDDLVSSQYKSDEPGAAVLVAKEGKIIYEKGFGTANLELNIPVKPESVFEIGSITKQFTAVSVLMLTEQGKLSLDDEITKYIEDYPTRGHKITIHHLLTHTSGIKSYTNVPELMKLGRNDYEPGEFIDLFKDYPPDFDPGEKFLYNNSGYFILGYIIEKASGMPYSEFIESQIFKPLGMKNSFYGSMRKIIKGRASGYQKNDVFVNAEYLSLKLPYAAGSIMSTTHDLYIWNRALKDNKLIKKESLEKAYTDYKLNNGDLINYGYGWMFGNIKGSKVIQHGGGIYGYTTMSIWLPEEDVFVAVFTNRDDIGPGTIALKIAALVIGKPYPEANPNIKLDEKFMKELIGVYDFEDETSRYITYEAGQLYSQREGSSRFKLFPVTENTFVFENSVSTISFSKKKKKIEALFEGTTKTKGFKTKKAIPERESIILDEEILIQYIGVYEIQTNFTIRLTFENGSLKAQATGQGSFELFAESDSKFFLKEIDAQIEFFKNETGAVSHLILYQGGQEIKGEKKK